MKLTYKNREQLLSLKAKIKGLAAEGARTRQFISKSQGERKHYYWEKKREIGKEARYHLIAYGLLRGKPYREIEPQTDPNKLTQWLFDYNYLAQIIQKHCWSFDCSKWSPANLQRLLNTGKFFADEAAA